MSVGDFDYLKSEKILFSTKLNISNPATGLD
jgi:hypothetical protein